MGALKQKYIGEMQSYHPSEVKMGPEECFEVLDEYIHKYCSPSLAYEFRKVYSGFVEERSRLNEAVKNGSQLADQILKAVGG